MKNNIVSRTFIVIMAALMLMGGFSVTAYAGGGEEIPPPPETIEQPAEPERPPNPVALTPDGNLTLVDDIQGEQSEDKQYMTVVTKNGNYFYIIIDRAGDKENVYFLNMVDEADLLALIKDDDKQPSKPVVTPQPEPDPQPTTEPEPKPQKKSGTSGILLLLLIVAGAGGGAFYYFKVLKPKQATQGGSDLSELDELDFDDEDDGLLSMGEAEPTGNDEE